MFANRFEEVTDEAIGSPIGHADFSSTAADSCHFRCGGHLIGRKHRTEAGSNDVERFRIEGQILGVGFLEGDIQSIGFGTLLTAIEQLLNVIGGYHITEATSSSE